LNVHAPAMQRLAANGDTADEWIPFAEAVARIDATTELHHTMVVELYPGEDAAVLRALDEIEPNPAPTSALGRLRRALIAGVAEDVN
jgi:hypothetical protein